eukprot:5274373-Prymnesium_polylepis.1
MRVSGEQDAAARDENYRAVVERADGAILPLCREDRRGAVGDVGHALLDARPKCEGLLVDARVSPHGTGAA